MFKRVKYYSEVWHCHSEEFPKEQFIWRWEEIKQTMYYLRDFEIGGRQFVIRNVTFFLSKNKKKVKNFQAWMWTWKIKEGSDDGLGPTRLHLD